MVVAAGHQHHAEIVPRVDALRALADDIHSTPPAEVIRRLTDELAFVREQLLPHMEMAETNLYPRLEQLLEDPRAMEPMRREHAEVRRLLAAIDGVRAGLVEERIPLRDELSLCRSLYRLFSIMRVHLHEEEHYLALLERNAEPAELEALRAAMEHASLGSA